MRVTISMVLLVTALSACSSYQKDSRLLSGFVGLDEISARDRLQALYRSSGGDYPIFFYDRLSGRAYISSIGESRTLGAWENIVSPVGIERISEEGVAYKYRCLESRSCSSDDPAFCTSWIKVDEPIGSEEREAIVSFFRERAYPVNYVDFVETPPALSVRVQYFSECEHLNQDIEKALSSRRIKSSAGTS
jgi:hypothetical protein